MKGALNFLTKPAPHAIFADAHRVVRNRLADSCEFFVSFVFKTIYHWTTHPEEAEGTAL